jgi:urease accessory protein
MILVESVVGNERDPAWRERLDGAAVDSLRLDQWQAQKNRFRRRTDADVEIAVALVRNTHLRVGDILHWDEDRKGAIVVRIRLLDVLVVRLDGVLDQPAEVLARTCVELGHALGNQHWPAVVKGSAVYVPLTVDRQVMASVMKTHAFAGIAYEFQPGAEVIPFLAPHEARRLFGGADSTPHSHVPGHSHAQEQDHPHEHTHIDAEGRRYTHAHAQERRHGDAHDHDEPGSHPRAGGASGPQDQPTSPE